MAQHWLGGIALVIACHLSTAGAAQVSTDVEEGVRTLAHAKTLSTSVERILMHGCYVTVGLDDGDRAAISAEIEAFTTAARTLRDGDDATPALRARGPLFALDRTETAWADFSDFARFATHGNFNQPYLARMYDLHVPVVENAQGVSKRLAAAYSNARIDAFSSSTLTNFADMRADATLIAAYHCMLSLDVQPEAARAGLAARSESYAKRLEIAFGGSDDAQVLTASVNGVQYLRCLWRSYGVVQERINPVADGTQTPSFTDVADLRAQLEYIVNLSDETVGIFTAELKGEEITPSGCTPLSS
ncbi:MAG: hypothetical protein AAFQ36_07020 [Pseudomonadota bacterium]